MEPIPTDPIPQLRNDPANTSGPLLPEDVNLTPPIQGELRQVVEPEEPVPEEPVHLQGDYVVAPAPQPAPPQRFNIDANVWMQTVRMENPDMPLFQFLQTQARSQPAPPPCRAAPQLQVPQFGAPHLSAARAATPNMSLLQYLRAQKAEQRAAAPPRPSPCMAHPPAPHSAPRAKQRPAVFRPPSPPRRPEPKPSTSANPPPEEDEEVKEEEQEDDLDRPLSPTLFTNGLDPINIAPRHLKNHPLHKPTGTSETLTFYPRLDEFENFNRYIRKVEAVGAHLKSGIAKIVAPDGWTPRPTKKDFSDADEYVIATPSTEKTKTAEKKGVYLKENFIELKNLKVKDFRAMANSAKYRNPVPHLHGVDLENYYFDHILEGFPIYGADTEGSFYEDGIKEWNMKNLGTILNELDYEIKGVNTVYLYFGMYKTTFPWHAEDMDLYSINYLHFGAPKYWFAISSEYADRFERFMSQQFSYNEEFTPHCKAFLRHKTCVITPDLIRQAGIPYSTMTQRPNEFIITFPRGYHMGFNTGYNLAESTNFAAPRWIDYGKDAVLCDCSKASVKIQMHNYLAKYRPNLYDVWDKYWYKGERFYWQPKRKKDIPKKRKADLTYENTAKRIRLGVFDDEDDDEYNSDDSEDEAEAFQRALEGYDVKVCMMMPQYEEMMRVFRRETKYFRATSRINFWLEKQYNRTKAQEWPHCAVCSYFQPTHAVASIRTLPETSRRLIPAHCFAKNGVKIEGEPENDRLITCKNCLVTVHSKCYTGANLAEDEDWFCQRCIDSTEHEHRQTTCALCELRGGALIRCLIGQNDCWAHVICGLMNRRATFDRAIGPTRLFVEPQKHQLSVTNGMPPLTDKYKNELGELYESFRLECVACKQIREGLVPCVLCIEEFAGDIPVMAHVTCARRVGFTFEIRDHPRDCVMVCHRHHQTYLSRPAQCTTVKVNDNIFVEEEAEDGSVTYGKGTIARQQKKETAVVDFYDNTCSRDILAGDIQSCECLYCEGGDHQYGSRLKVLWDDSKVYDGYYRGKGSMMEYTIQMEDGKQVKHPRSKLKTKREFKALKGAVLSSPKQSPSSAPAS
ncbi:hypothetical protein CAEBREN_25826 [Caenorhabditis brenneri]|uniref:[histone H3]-trimethyl-L-lysine(9) demethylase n=1 Tax=Caenorhabditis brenneri TaxID=135651 RepID=G0MQ64_CAEBE|nr:hypothetical protein CAEBREN_25826 [Caenorhabditis brenneri]